jgi:hypothetical protein
VALADSAPAIVSAPRLHFLGAPCPVRRTTRVTGRREIRPNPASDARHRPCALDPLARSRRARRLPRPGRRADAVLARPVQGRRESTRRTSVAPQMGNMRRRGSAAISMPDLSQLQAAPVETKAPLQQRPLPSLQVGARPPGAWASRVTSPLRTTLNTRSVRFVVRGARRRRLGLPGLRLPAALCGRGWAHPPAVRVSSRFAARRFGLTPGWPRSINSTPEHYRRADGKLKLAIAGGDRVVRWAQRARTRERAAGPLGPARRASSCVTRPIAYQD